MNQTAINLRKQRQTQGSADQPDPLEHLITMENQRNLPTEIVSDILSRVPVKSLCRFRCVSKPWLSLITHPDFVKLHYNRAFEKEGILHQRRRVLIDVPGSNSLFSFGIDEFLKRNDHGGDAEVEESDIDCVYCHEELDSGVMLVVPCNGLLFFTVSNLDLYLLNPATRESKKLPGPEGFGMDGCSHHLFGFGFDHSADDYKVVYGRCFDDGVDFGVYMLKTGSWRVIEERYPYKRAVTDDSKGILVNGGFHWLSRRIGDQSIMIMAFLLAEEEVREIEAPPDFTESDLIYFSLGAFRECLCVSQWILQDAGNHEFWVMKDYGVSESWTKIKLSIVMLDSGNILPAPYRTKSHDLLFAKWISDFYLYNFDDHTFRTMSITLFQEFRDAEVYLESLVPLN
ncbi:hypothetical protein PRUPE_6G125500 [Prunus persica]|uniref:F-box domain-containing protein n=1 Tax=Prunus persica TaxID=3760 RepID=A0A251NS60_PRUPE|nr:F-box/kelch-repeat protein At3g06240 [Prunus persica]ONI01165.1 hypothetical protein PRUPE_6G125500 [Prunus persica]